MFRLSILTIVLSVILLSNTANALSSSLARLHRARPSFALHIAGGSMGSMGSDVLERPDNEDGPEFREYLKRLLKLQANRAKNGFVAPSSGSSDAYVAKLNRIKLERAALREAGLPDADIDMSYRSEDYENAVSEMAEPLVSNAVLTGDAAIPGRRKAGGKTRPLSHEEISAARSAKESVARILESQNGQLQPRDNSITEGYDPIKKLTAPNSEVDPVIDNMLDKMLTPPGKAAAAPAPAAQRSGPRYSPPVRAAATQQAAPAKAVPPPAPVAAPVQKQQPVAAMAAVPESGRSLQLGTRKLDTAELEVAAAALQSLVKHRGGGPFGSGRLRGSELREMKKNLVAAVQMLSKDATVAPVERAVVPAAPVAKAPAPKAAPAPDAMADIAKCPAMSDSSPLPVMNDKRELEYPESLRPSPAEEGQPVPIALGLDKFLQAPRSLQTNELSALRDALIQCLAMVQTEVTTRSQESAPSFEAPSPMDRLLKSAARAEQQATAEGPSSFDKDLKLALGMLLKHRGGPGFGHGRLQGRELQMMKDKLTFVAQELLAEAQ